MTEESDNNVASQFETQLESQSVQSSQSSKRRQRSLSSKIYKGIRGRKRRKGKQSPDDSTIDSSDGDSITDDFGENDLMESLLPPNIDLEEPTDEEALIHPSYVKFEDNDDDDEVAEHIMFKLFSGKPQFTFIASLLVLSVLFVIGIYFLISFAETA